MASVLFVSYDADLRAVATRVLQRAGFSVRTAAHGGRAMLAAMEDPAIDAAVIEHRMPDGSGDPLVAWLSRYCPGIAIVRMCDGAVGHGGDGTVVRPFTSDDLLDAIYTRLGAISR